MTLIMENWQKYVNEVAEQEGIETDNVIFLFEQSQITTCDFNVLLERLRASSFLNT